MSSYGAEQPWTPFLGGTLAGPPGEQEMTTAVSPPAGCRRLTEVRVAVVGGGLAGLYAAWLLQQQGLAVTLFEASNRLGGRVLSSRDFIPGKVVEAGAELIGMNHPTWQALAKRFGLTLTKITGDPDGRIRFGHHELSAKQLADLAVDRRAVQYAIGQDALVVNQVEPWLSPRAAALDATTVRDALDKIFQTVSLRNKDITRQYLDLVIGNDTNAPPERLSYLGLLSKVSSGRMGTDMLGYWECTETHRCAGGSQQLVSKLAQPLGTSVRLNWPVSILELRQEGVRVMSCRAGGAYMQDFDYVILAAPPKCWPQIDAPVPFPRCSYTMADGPAVKFLTRFDKQFSTFAPSARWDQLGQTWESTESQHGGKGFGLTVYSGGSFILSEPEYAARLNVLYPGYRAHVNKEWLVDWANTMWIGTGYSTPAPGQVTTVGQQLSLPFQKRLYFAGEHACVPFHGYMEGALQSGARAAGSITSAVCTLDDRARVAEALPVRAGA
jgi:monoamine oxidase